MMVNKALIVKENDELTKKLVQNLKFDHTHLLKEENDILRNQLT